MHKLNQTPTASRLIVLCYLILTVSSWLIWIGGWRFFHLTAHHPWRESVPIIHLLFVVTGLGLLWANRSVRYEGALLVDAALSIGTSLSLPLIAALGGGEGGMVLGYYYLGATVIRCFLLMVLFHKSAPVFSRTWYGRLIPTVFVIVVAFQEWRLAINQLSGDEPYYLLIAHSLVADGDFQLENNYHEPQRMLLTDIAIKEFYFEYNSLKYPHHPPGLPIFLAIGYFIAKVRGALWLMALSGALLLREWFKLASIVCSSPRLVIFCGYLFFFTYPLFPYFSLIYPEIPAALLFTVILRLGLEKPTLGTMLLNSIFVLLLTTVKLRLLLLGGPTFIILGVRFLLIKKRAYLQIGIITVICLTLLLLYFYQSIGFIHVLYRVRELMTLRLTNLKPYQGFFGILLDQQFGLLWRNPLYLLGLAGVVAAPRRLFPHKRLFVGALLPYWVTLVTIEFWTGGSTPPPRLLVPVLPTLALFSLPILQFGWFSRTRFFIIGYAVGSSLLSLFFPQSDVYLVDNILGVSRITAGLGRVIGYPISRFFPSYFRTGIGTHIWSSCLILFLVIVWCKAKKNFANGKLILPPNQTLKSVVMYSGIFAALSFLLPAIPPMKIYPQDGLFPQNSGLPLNTGFLINDRFSFRFKPWSCGQKGLLWALDEGSSPNGVAVDLEVEGERIEEQWIVCSQSQPTFWEINCDRNPCSAALVKVAYQSEKEPTTLLNRFEIIPNSPMLSRLSRFFTWLFRPLWRREELKSRNIRAYLMDQHNPEAAQAVLDYYLSERDYLNIGFWIENLPSAVTQKLPFELRLNLATHMSYRRKDSLVRKLLIDPVPEKYATKVYELLELAQLRDFESIDFLDRNRLLTSVNLELLYRIGALDLREGRTETFLRIAEQLLEKNNMTYNRLILKHLSDSKLEPPPSAPKNGMQSHLIFDSTMIQATTGISARDGWHLTSNGSISFEFPAPEKTVSCTLRLKGSMAQGRWPEAVVYIDGQRYARFRVASTDWLDYRIYLKTEIGPHLLELEFTNDYYYAKDNSDRNLYFNVCLIDT